MRGTTSNGVYNSGFVYSENPADMLKEKNINSSAINDGSLPALDAMKTNLDRPVLQQKHFKEFYQEHTKLPTENIIQKVGQYCRKQCSCSGQKIWKTFQRKIPILYWIPRYDIKANLIADILGGLTVGIMQIPQGMGYALLADMPPVMGLYVSFFAVLIYFIFGTSRHLSQGTFSVISLMTANVVNNYLHSRHDGAMTTMAPFTTASPLNITTSTMPAITTTPNPRAELETEKVYLAIAMSFMVGIIQIILSFVQLGALSVYLSENLVSGFTTGAAVHVFTSQIKYLLGIHVGNFRGLLGIVYIYIDIFRNISHTNLVTLAISACVIVLLIIITDFVNAKYQHKLIMPIPIELFVVVTTTLASYYINLHEDYGVAIVYHIPNGLPAPELPRFDIMQNLIGGAFSVSIVSFCISVSLAIIFAKRGAYDIDPNQELFAYGCANLFSSFFCCFPCCASLSRSTVQVNSGSKTQLCSVVALILVGIALLFLGPCFEPIPICVLSGIIVVALRKLFYQISDCIAAWKVSKMDAIIWIVTFWAVVLCDVDYGLIVSLSFLLIVFMFRAQRPYTTVLGNVPNTETYLDIQKYQAPREVRGIKIIHFGGALYFANVEYFRQKLYKLVFSPITIFARLEKQEKAAKRLEDKRIKAQRKRDNAFQQHSIGSMNDATIFKQIPKQSGNLDTNNSTNSPSVTASTVTIQSAYQGEFFTGIFESQNNAGGTSRLPAPPLYGTIQAIIIDCSAVSFVDTPALSMINQLYQEYEKIDVQLCLAGCRDKVMGKLEKSIFYSKLEKNIFPTIHDAVLHTVKLPGAPHRIEIEDNGSTSST